jgi:ADP-heptose:LPS heptosyltransferase
VEKILFIRLRLLGDIIFTIPSIEIFKKYYPDTSIYYVVEEESREIAELIPGIHQLIVIPRKMGFFKMWKFRKDIRSLGIDTVVDFHSGPKGAQLTRLTGAKVRIGYKTPNRNFAYNKLTPRKFGNSFTHSVYNQAKLLEHLNIPIDSETIPQYPVIPIDESRIRDWVKLLVNEKDKKKAVIHVGAGKTSRDWGIENFASLVQKLKQNENKNETENDWSIFIVGKNDEEKKKGEYLEKHFQIHNLTGKISLLELLYLISRSTVYVGADSGPLHLASLTSTPLVGLYGPNIPEISGPWREKNVSVIRKYLPCQPCNQKKCEYEKDNHKKDNQNNNHGIISCMKNITTDEVYEAIIRYS